MSLDTFPKDDATVSALAFDFGTHRIGVAYGQSLTGTARSLCVMKANDGIPDWNSIATLIEEWRPNALVVGLPYNLDGSESELLNRAIKFGHRLHGRFNLPIYGMDERLSSHAAIEQVIEENESQKRTRHIDDVAAQIILENWFNEFRNQTNHQA